MRFAHVFIIIIIYYYLFTNIIYYGTRGFSTRKLILNETLTFLVLRRTYNIYIYIYIYIVNYRIVKKTVCIIYICM